MARGLSVQVPTLRFPEPDDAPAIFAAVRESIEELHRWMAWCRRDFALADAAQWVAGQPEARSTGSAFEFVIVGQQGRVLGCCGVNQISKDDRSANFGYWVRTSETRRGVGTQAGRLLAQWVFANTDLVRLEIVAAVGNDASLALAEKLGAWREGVLRSRLLIHGTFHDAVVLSLIRPRQA